MVKKQQLLTLKLAYILPPEKGLLPTTIKRKFSLPRRTENLLWPSPLSAPFSITKALHEALSDLYRVLLYDWRDANGLNLRTDDIFVFHPEPERAQSSKDEKEWCRWEENYIGYRTMRKNKSSTAIAIVPYTSDSDSWIEGIFKACHGRVILICGAYWKEHFHTKSLIGKKYPQVRNLELGIKLSDYPFLREKFNPKGKRKVLYIGHTGSYKNPEGLERIREALPDVVFSHIGHGSLKGFNKLGFNLSFKPDFVRNVMLDHDLFINLSHADAEPATVLEQMSWGTPVLMTKESGYGFKALTQLSPTDVEFNKAQVLNLLNASNDELFLRVKEQRQLVEEERSWPKFLSSIKERIIECANSQSMTG